MTLVHIHPNVSLLMSLWHVILSYGMEILKPFFYILDSKCHVIHNQMTLSHQTCVTCLHKSGDLGSLDYESYETLNIVYKIKILKPPFNKNEERATKSL